jgi:hypothetical protein
MSSRPRLGLVATRWSTASSGKSVGRTSRIGVPSENISDGLQIFHNPYARNPLDLQIFRRDGVVQHYHSKAGWVREEYDTCLQFRLTQTTSLHDGKSSALQIEETGAPTSAA